MTAVLLRSAEGEPMFRKVRDSFTATHFTILSLGAMFVPSALYAVVSYQPVAIVNANTGTKANVDTSGRLFTYDPVVDPSLAYAYNPANLVKSTASCTNTSFTLYTPPDGKALFIRSVNIVYYNGTLNADNYGYVYGDGAVIAAAESPQVVGVQNSLLNYYTSSPVRFGCGPGVFQVTLTGYLMPSTSVPQLAEAKDHESHVGPYPPKSGKLM